MYFGSVPEGRLKPPTFQPSLRDCGYRPRFFPALEVPGYSRCVPLGRESTDGLNPPGLCLSPTFFPGTRSAGLFSLRPAGTRERARTV